MVKVFEPGMNKRLWGDDKLFGSFLGCYLQLIGHIVMEKEYNASYLLDITNKLDDIMQEYEGKYGPLEDPQFYWTFATANAYFLFQGGKDKIGNLRIKYVVNGYIEALERHNRYPSLSKDCIDEAFSNMKPFLAEDGEKWMIENRNKYLPLPQAHELIDQMKKQNGVNQDS
jgi:hypothetical protein